ncbi:neuroguidin-like [Babylonia areolata]|uniref:neuroguidin-like n=1 Tax=Babylonia areolata TaxID=304850 RepID=UPI003FD43BEE
MATQDVRAENGVHEEAIVQSMKDALEAVKGVASHEAITQGFNAKGISLLETKNQLMMQYLQDLALVIGKKLTGHSIKDHPAIWRLIQNRTFLEKTVAIEEKLKYEISKLVKRHRFGDSGEPDGLKFKPNMDNFNVESDDEDDDDEEEDEEKDKSSDDDDEEDGKRKDGKGVYRPPKVAPMPYTADESVEEKERRVKRRALSNTLLADLRSEILDEPEEIVDSADLHRLHADRQRKEREEYEEKYFVRTSVSKKEKNKSRQVATMGSLEGLVRFDSYFGDEDAKSGPPAKKRRTSKGFKGKGKPKKGKGKKRHH